MAKSSESLDIVLSAEKFNLIPPLIKNNEPIGMWFPTQNHANDHHQSMEIDHSSSKKTNETQGTKS